MTKTILLILISQIFVGYSLSQSPELYVQTGHSDGISSVIFSPDGKTLVSGSNDETIKIWDVRSGNELRTTGGHTSDVEDLSINSVIFSPDGTKIAGGSRIIGAEIVYIWNLKDNRLKVFSSPPVKALIDGTYDINPDYFNKIEAVAFSPNGQEIVSGSERKLRLWNIDTGEVKLTFKGTFGAITSVVFSPDSKTIISGDDKGDIISWDVRTGEQLKILKGDSSKINSLQLNPNGKILASAGSDNTIRLWDVKSGLELKTLIGHSSEVLSLAFSSDGKKMASGSKDKTIKLWDIENGNVIRTFYGHTESVNSVALQPNGNVLASGSDDKTIKLWDINNGKEVRTFLGNAGWTKSSHSFEFSPDGKLLVDSNQNNKIIFWLLENGNSFSVLPDYSANSVTFTEDSKILAVGDYERKKITLLEIESKKVVHTINGYDNCRQLVFSEDEKKIAANCDNKTKIWDIETRAIIKEINENMTSEEEKYLEQFPGINLMYFGDAFSEKLVVNVNSNGKFKLIDRKTEKELVTLFVTKEDNWLVTTPEGFFDGTPNAWKQLIWRFDNNTFDYAPVEAFFKEFYRPGLLQDIFNGVPIEPPTTDLSKIDIRQPSVKIAAVDDKAVDSSALLPEKVSADKKSVKVKVEITDNTSKPRSVITAKSSDAQDVRLFRNGSLVRLWGKVDKKSGKSVSIFDFTEQDGCRQIPATKDSPRKAVCETEIAITAGENELTAYGFNHQDVKSSDNTALVVGAESLKRDGTLYVLAIGVNQYKNTDYNLNYAVKDVVEIGKALQEQQTKLGDAKQYAKTEVITLTDKSATKENILNALGRFANSDKTAIPENISDELKAEFLKIKQTQPEDAVVIYFAGHGVSKKQRFYLLPHNFTGDADLLESQSVSDLELNEYLEKVDAGKILMTIDACQSGQALGGKNDGKAPMNSKGFAQLAYDKGMFILTAAQSQQAALEAVNLNGKIIENGLLTYTLLEALKDKESDKDGNQQIWEKEWFDFATSKVPQMQLEAMKNRSVEVKKGEKDKQGKRKVEIFYVEGDSEENPDERRVQTPRIFYKRESDANPLIVAKP